MSCFFVFPQSREQCREDGFGDVFSFCFVKINKYLFYHIFIYSTSSFSPHYNLGLKASDEEGIAWGYRVWLSPLVCLSFLKTVCVCSIPWDPHSTCYMAGAQEIVELVSIAGRMLRTENRMLALWPEPRL